MKKNNLVSNLKSETVDQIKNIFQEKKTKPDTKKDSQDEIKLSINSFDQLLETCIKNKEIKLKYELEKNVNLVRFEKNRVEISFNENLDKNFLKDLSLKLFEWTGERWIITLSKSKGEISIKEKQEKKKLEIFEKVKKSKLYKDLKAKFSDANLIEVVSKKERKD